MSQDRDTALQPGQQSKTLSQNKIRLWSIRWELVEERGVELWVWKLCPPPGCVLEQEHSFVENDLTLSDASRYVSQARNFFTTGSSVIREQMLV